MPEMPKLKKQTNQPWWRNLLIYAAVILIASFIIFGFFQPQTRSEIKPISEVLNAVKEDKVDEVILDGLSITAQFKNGDNIMSFARSKAKLFNKDNPKVKFGDVAGVDEAKQELQEVVEFLKSREKFREIGRA